ncbi:hypothetical protein OLZ33_07555 [Pantoea ananatis]|uniref:hypothetical protein n=1 Tax=Pantoea ananas TaxID=553 RepID=UPI00222174DD|nr:hypothetical protein [Pantoea ananatis]MCW1831862.1 hypothetical protein [Pantoea ananatis]
MDALKEIKIKYKYNGIENQDIIKSYGYDRKNEVIEFLAEKYVPAQLIESQSRGGKRNQLGKRNLIEYGVSQVSYYHEDDNVWVDLQDIDLRKI